MGDFPQKEVFKHPEKTVRQVTGFSLNRHAIKKDGNMETEILAFHGLPAACRSPETASGRRNMHPTIYRVAIFNLA